MFGIDWRRLMLWFGQTAELGSNVTDGLRERTEHLDIFLFSAHHSMAMFCLLVEVEGECQILAF